MITVILVEPEGEENVGAAARAMMNMGADALALVKPRCDHLSEGAFCYAVHAKDVLQNALLYSSLEEASAGAELTIAVTRRVGQWRKKDFYLPDLPPYLERYEGRDIRLVFGREKSGLTNDEIRLCDLVCAIPSSEKFPSLNLAQAVMVVLYELFRHKKAAKLVAERAVPPGERKHFNDMLDSIIRALDELDFFKTVPEWRLRNYLRKVLLRASPDAYDTMVIKRVFERIAGKVRKFKKASS